MKTIIAPTDFSKASYNACLYAANLAADNKAELVLLHVMELPIAVAEYPVTANTFDEAGIAEELETLRNKLCDETKNKINIRTRNILGSAEYEIKELSETIKPFAVVMGTHSYGVIDRFFLGSTTVYTAKHLHSPVIIVPPNATYKTIKKIALATDLKDIYEAPADEIEKIIKYFNAELEVFYAGKDENVVNRNAVTSVLLSHRLVRLNPQFYFVEDEDIMRGVTALAENHLVDMIIVIPKKHGPFHKSQTKDFIFYSSVPVMAIHENDLVSEL